MYYNIIRKSDNAVIACQITAIDESAIDMETQSLLVTEMLLQESFINDEGVWVMSYAPSSVEPTLQQRVTDMEDVMKLLIFGG